MLYSQVSQKVAVLVFVVPAIFKYLPSDLVEIVFAPLGKVDVRVLLIIFCLFAY